LKERDQKSDAQKFTSQGRSGFHGSHVCARENAPYHTTQQSK